MVGGQFVWFVLSPLTAGGVILHPVITGTRSHIQTRTRDWVDSGCACIATILWGAIPGAAWPSWVCQSNRRGDMAGGGEDSTISSATLLKARQGDEDAWHSIWSQYSGRVFRQALRFGLPASDAEDITLEVFRKVWQRLGDFARDEAGQSLGAWMNRITQTTVLDALKKARRAPEGLGDGAGLLPAAASCRADHSPSPLWLAFWQALGIVEIECSARAWECFRLARIAQLPHAEIAELLEMSVSNVSTTANRVFVMIREQCIRQLQLAQIEVDEHGRLSSGDTPPGSS